MLQSDTLIHNIISFSPALESRHTTFVCTGLLHYLAWIGRDLDLSIHCESSQEILLFAQIVHVNILYIYIAAQWVGKNILHVVRIWWFVFGGLSRHGEFQKQRSPSTIPLYVSHGRKTTTQPQNKRNSPATMKTNKQQIY